MSEKELFGPGKIPTRSSNSNPNVHAWPIAITLTNIFKYISLMSPLLILFFIIMLSIFNNTIIKGLIFTFGMLLTAVFNYILQTILKEPLPENMSNVICSLSANPFSILNKNDVFLSPSSSSSLLGFTLSYIILPMKMNNELNPALATFLLALLVVNGVVENMQRCSTIMGTVLGALFGIIFGILYYSMIAGTGNKHYAYFSEIISNSVKCNKPSKQKFKCVTYYRNSEIPIS